MPTSCPHCGHSSMDPRFCDECGGALGEELPPPLGPGQSLTFQVEGRRLEVTVEDRVSDLTPTPVWDARSPDGRRWRILRSALPPTGDDLPPDLVARLDTPASVRPDAHGHTVLLPHLHGRRWLRSMARRPPAASLRELANLLLPLLELLETAHRHGRAIPMLHPGALVERKNGVLALEAIHDLPRLGTTHDTLALDSPWAAPELLGHSAFPAALSPASDLHPLGMLAYLLVAGQTPPVVDEHPEPLLQARDFHPDFPLGAQRLIESLTHAEPSCRPPDTRHARDLIEQLLQEAPAGSGFPTILLAAETHIGVVKRTLVPVNQDALLAISDPDNDCALLAIADGVSTASIGAGDLASRIAIRTLHDAWTSRAVNERMSEAEEWLDFAIARANDAIIQHVNLTWGPFAEDPEDVMGSTMVACLIRGMTATFAALGDSPAFLFRDGHLERITRSHNLATMAMIDGLPGDHALGLPQADALVRCLGMFVCEDGQLVSDPAPVDLYTVPLREGDRILLCSDGLTDYAADAPSAGLKAILGILREEPDPDDAALALVHLANRGGGGDNISVAIADVLVDDAFEDVEDTSAS